MIETDVTTHHIEGYANAALHRPGGGAFSMPLVTHVVGNIWQGGCFNALQLGREYKYVVSLYPWEKYKLAEGTIRMEYEMFDGSDVPDEDSLHSAADHVVLYAEEGRTLVHCQAGLNRSGLVTGLALVKMGMEPHAAITLMREKRSPMVLCNQAFEAWLRRQA